MAMRYSRVAHGTIVPFLYPSLSSARPCISIIPRPQSSKASYTTKTSTVNDLPESRLNPAPDDYASPSFADRADITLYAGRGGNGCVSFQREAFLPDGPPNGGDGGSGGNVYIQAAQGETSLHKISRRRFARAGRGRHGQGSARSGTRGEDVIITVPVGTIVRELERQDPVAEEEMNMKAWRAFQKQKKREEREKEALKKKQDEEDGVEEWEEELDRRGRAIVLEPEEEDDSDSKDPQREKWLLYPGMTKNEMKSADFPRLPRRTRHLQQPPAPVYLDLSHPTPQPILLATGGVGGLGNTHFTSRDHPKPMFATKGDDAVTMKISLELKLLADVGLVGLPNAGKSTLLRALTNSRTRVGNWAFTTLQPNIGTVVLDKYSGRPVTTPARKPSLPVSAYGEDVHDLRTRFTVADIPGLIEGAHLDKGLGIAFLRHVERAGVLAFVIDLSAGNAVTALKSLWREVYLYAEMRDEEERAREAESQIDWGLNSDSMPQGTINLMNIDQQQPSSPEIKPTQHISRKPWYVVATKADLPETQSNFAELKEYMASITAGTEPHPSGAEECWTKNCAAVPVSAINGQGVDRIVHWTVGLFDETQ